MELVTVKNKFQIVIPQRIREKMHVEVGDLLEASIHNGKLVFTPKSLVDRHIAEGISDLQSGRSHGPYKTAVSAIAALEGRAANPKKR